MALTYRSPLEENFASYDSSVQAAIASTSATYYKDLEQENFRFFNYYIRPEGRKHLIEAGIYISPNAAVPHSHPVCKTLENHFLYIVLPPLLDNSFFFVGIKDAKIGMLKTRNSSLTMINKVNRYVTSLDRVRYGPEFVVRYSRPLPGMQRHQPSLAGATLENLIPPLMINSAKNLFLHDELHYWSHKDLITMLELLEPDVVYATFVYPPELLAGATSSLNKWCYTFDIIGKDLIFYPDGAKTEGYQQPLASGYLLKTRRIILNDGSYYNVDIVQSKFAHHLICISRGKEAGPTVRAFGPFQATSCKGLEPLTRDVSNCFPIPFEVVSRVYRYLRTLKKPDAQSAMAKLSQLLPEPDGMEIKFLQDFADLVINTKTVNTMLQADHVTLFFTKWLKKLPKIIAAKFQSVRCLSLDDFVSMLEPYSFHITLVDVDWSYNSYISLLDAEAEPEIDLVGLLDGRFLSGQLPGFSVRPSAPYEMQKKNPFPYYKLGLELGGNQLERLVIRVVINEVCTPELRLLSRSFVRELIRSKCLASKTIIFQKSKLVERVCDCAWLSNRLQTVISRYGRNIRPIYSDDSLLWLLSTDRLHTPSLTGAPHWSGFYRESARLWTNVTAEVVQSRPKLRKRALPPAFQQKWGEKEQRVHTEEVFPMVTPVPEQTRGPPVQPESCPTLACNCQISMPISPLPFPGDHGFKSPDQLRNRRVGWYAKNGVAYAYSGGKHECLGWPIWIEKWMDLNGIDPSYYDCCLYQVYEEGGAIGFHSDDEAIFEPGGQIFTGNLLGEATFLVRCSAGEGQVRLTAGSCFTMPFDFQNSHKHSVKATTEGRASVTFRKLRVVEVPTEEPSSESDETAIEDSFITDLKLGKIAFSKIDRDLKYTSHEVPGDGSCFWHSLEVHTGMAAMEIKRICKQVTFPDAELQSELQRQLGEKVFAEEVAIMAAATVLKATITIHGAEEGISATFLPNVETTRSINLEKEHEHFRPVYPINNCLIKALSLGLQRKECDLLRVIEEQLGEQANEIWRGEGVALETMEAYFTIFDVCALLDTVNGSRVLNGAGRFPLSFLLRDQHIEFVGKNPQVNVALNFGEQVGLSVTEASLVFLDEVGSKLKYEATRDRAFVLAKCFESGSTGVINSKLFNNVDVLITPEHPERLEVEITGIFGTFGAGKSTIFKRFFDLNEGKNIVYVSPRKALAEEFKSKLTLKGKVGKLKSKHWRVLTFEVMLKQMQLPKPGSVVILDEIQLYPPGYLDLIIILLARGVRIVVGGDPCQSEYDNEKDRAWLSMIPRDLDRLLEGQNFKYNTLSRRFTNANFIGRLPCEHPPELAGGKLSEHFLLGSLEEVRVMGGSYGKTFLVSSFEEKKIVETHFFDMDPKVLTFGESTGLNFSKGTILITNIAHLTSERRWVTALSRFSKNISLVNLTGTTWENLLQVYKGRVLARFLTKTACLGDLHKLIPGKPSFQNGFEDKVGRNEGQKEEKMQGDPWLKGMLDLFQLEDVEEEEELLEECEEEWFKTHLPQAELEGVRARWVHRILAKEFREVRMGYNVSEQFTDDYAKEEGQVLTNAAERFEAIYPRHRANDTVTFFMAVKKRLRFSRPATEKAKLIEAQHYGKFLLSEFLKKIPLKSKHDPALMDKAKADFEEKKVSKSAATIENHAGRSCRDWLIDVGLIFSKSQLCTKFDNRFRVAKAAQSIVCFQHAVLCRFAPYMRYIEMKLHQALPKNYYIHSGKGLEELDAWVKKGRFDGICTESDYEAFDASQDQYMVAFEVEVMRYLGLPSDLIEDYKFIKTHLGSKLGNFAIMRFSGEASTFLFNTMANMLFTFLRYEIKGHEYICFAGDDMCASTRLTTKTTHAGFLNKLKLKAKVFMVDKPTFCGWHLSPDGIYKKPQLVMERMCIAKEKNNLANCIDNYAIEVSFAYRLGERAVNRMDEEELEAFYNCVRIIVKNKHLLKSDIATLFTRALAG